MKIYLSASTDLHSQSGSVNQALPTHLVSLGICRFLPGNFLQFPIDPQPYIWMSTYLQNTALPCFKSISDCSMHISKFGFNNSCYTGHGYIGVIPPSMQCSWFLLKKHGKINIPIFVARKLYACIGNWGKCRWNPRYTWHLKKHSPQLPCLLIPPIDHLQLN